ncbi:MAG: hypothetical protein FD177_231 [Desulfovibrionaceae bacterium]|nr:MAG: hypothetical protein FD177_231 [Desulfovibrionaceae bacterium]
MVPLIAPPEFYALTPEQKADICNGCGARGSHVPVPDTIWGLDIREACNIHDYNYGEGRDKNRSDAVFIVNIVLLAVYAFLEWPMWARWAAFPLLVLRVLRAITYGMAVITFGGAAFGRAK